MTPKHFHFIGIGGAAMAPTAVALRALGHRVTGSDRAVYPPMSNVLSDSGITYCEGYAPENLPEGADLHVVGNAISRGNPELETILDRKLPYGSMAELLKREVIQGRRSFVVTGTHGKTTTTSLLAWIFEHAGRDPGYLIGGAPQNFATGARFNDSPFFVIEGDEYDTAYFDKRSKFVHYLPECAIVNNIEFDHADIFDDLAAILKSFRQFLNLVPRNGLVLMNGDDANCLSLRAACPAPTRTIGTSAACDERLVILHEDQDGIRFQLNDAGFRLPMNGEFNARNAAMCICAARFAGLNDDEIRAGLAAFQGIRRRQQVRGDAGGITLIDDFGHHPTALRATLDGLRGRYPGRRLLALFEPRSNTSRRNVLQPQLIEALTHADLSVVAAVNDPAKIPDDQRLDVDVVSQAVTAAGRPCFHEPDTEAIVARVRLEARPGDVVIVFSNGGFDGIHDKLLATLG